MELLTDDQLNEIFGIPSIGPGLLALPFVRYRKMLHTAKIGLRALEADMPLCGHQDCIDDWLRALEDIHNLIDSISAAEKVHLN